MAKYDRETLTVLRNALDEAWALLPDDRKSESQKSDMARRILKKAAEGVRDPVRLRASALVRSWLPLKAAEALREARTFPIGPAETSCGKLPWDLTGC
jgi:hypothetical protein